MPEPSTDAPELPVLSADCPNCLLVDQISDRWSMRILVALNDGPARFSAIKRRLDGVSQKSLTQGLRRLERNGLVARRVIPSSQVAVEYRITPLGLTLEQPFLALLAWTERHRDAVEQARREFDGRAEP